MNGATNALLWKRSETQNFTYLTILKHQNTKTSLNELSKNHWVIALFEIFGSVRKEIQSTVFNDHPVLGFGARLGGPTSLPSMTCMMIAMIVMMEMTRFTKLMVEMRSDL